MSKDKAEEKAYLQDLFEYMSNEHGLILTQSEMLEILSISGKEYDNVQFELGEIERQSSSLSTENAQLREALRGIIKECEEWIIPSSENSNNCENNHHVDIDDLKSLIDKAKQLLTDNTK